MTLSSAVLGLRTGEQDINTALRVLRPVIELVRHVFRREDDMACGEEIDLIAKAEVESSGALAY
jgi:hypothetical protein